MIRMNLPRPAIRFAWVMEPTSVPGRGYPFRVYIFWITVSVKPVGSLDNQQLVCALVVVVIPGKAPAVALETPGVRKQSTTCPVRFGLVTCAQVEMIIKT